MLKKRNYAAPFVPSYLNEKMMQLDTHAIVTTQQQQPDATGRGLKRKINTTIKTPLIYLLGKSHITWKLIYEDNDGIDYIDLTNKSVHAMKSNLIDYQQERRACKFNISLHINFKKAADPTVVTELPVVLDTEQTEMYEYTEIQELLTICSEQPHRSV